MSKEQRRLGRGLSSIISLDALPASLQQSEPASAPGGKLGVHEVPVEIVMANPYQPRESIDSRRLEELAASIRQTGVLQPVLVRKRGESYEIIAGERRLRAARIAGLSTIPVLVRDADERQMLEMALIENLQREDLNPIERANAYRTYCTKFGLSVQELADRLGEDRSTVANILRLLELPEQVKEMVSRGLLSMGHARCLLGISDASTQLQLARKASELGWPVRRLEQLAQSAKKGDAAGPSSQKHPARPQIALLEQRLSDALSTRVRIAESRRRGRGKVVIEYFSLEDFDRLMGRLGVRLNE